MRRKRKTKAQGSAESFSSHFSVVQHRRGDEHAHTAFHYECGWRCLWMLELYGTSDQLKVFEDDDCLIIKKDLRIYRQVKKRATEQWPFNYLCSFIERAYDHFKNDRTALHEFYTDANVSREIMIESEGVKHLNPECNNIRKIAGEDAEKFCESVTIYERKRHAAPDRMKLDVAYKSL